MIRRLKLGILAAVLLIVFGLAFGWAGAQVATPLPALGPGFYLGQQGGLYPGGENDPPAGYLAQLAAVADDLAADGQLVVLCLGMSAMQNMCSGFGSGAGFGYAVNPAFTAVNGAIGSKQQQWTDPGHSVWDRGLQMLASQGLTADQVDVVLYHNTIGGLAGGFPESAMVLQDSLQLTMDIIPTKYTNTRLILVNGRYHALFAPSGSKSPEPYAYESNFAVKWLIADRIDCLGSCGPLLAWSAHLWDPSWPAAWYVSDGIHLSNEGKTAAGQVWADYFASTSFIAPWYLATGQPPPTATPGATATATPAGGTATATPFLSTATATSIPAVTPTVCFYNHCR